MTTAQRERPKAADPALGDAMEVLDASGDDIELVGDAGPVRATRAASCLLAPQPGDTALVVTTRSGARWVIAVLARAERSEGRLEWTGDLSLRVREGRLLLAAQAGVDVVTARAVTVASASLDLSAGEGRVAVERFACVGDRVELDVDDARVRGLRLDLSLDRVSSRVNRAFRVVAEVDQLRAGQVDHSAETVMHLRAKNTVLTAEELVKVDGEQIHLG